MSTNDAAVDDSFQLNDGDNVYRAPEAELTEISKDSPILNMRRFSAWGVIFFSLITLSVYFYYWMYSRSKQINSLSKVNKVNMTLLSIYIVIAIVTAILPYVLSTVMTNMPTSVFLNTIYVIYGVQFISLIAYLIVLYSMRRALVEMINTGNNTPVKLGGVKTFFFSIIYFQYKINQAIDIAKG